MSKAVAEDGSPLPKTWHERLEQLRRLEDEGRIPKGSTERAMRNYEEDPR